MIDEILVVVLAAFLGFALAFAAVIYNLFIAMRAVRTRRRIANLASDSIEKHAALEINRIKELHKRSVNNLAETRASLSEVKRRIEELNSETMALDRKMKEGISESEAQIVSEEILIQLKELEADLERLELEAIQRDAFVNEVTQALIRFPRTIAEEIVSESFPELTDEDRRFAIEYLSGLIRSSISSHDASNVDQREVQES